ncbi:hypothetical protein GEMRC1_006840 [Eukaryota sp. GEM-RC1]
MSTNQHDWCDADLDRRRAPGPRRIGNTDFGRNREPPRSIPRILNTPFSYDPNFTPLSPMQHEPTWEVYDGLRPKLLRYLDLSQTLRDELAVLLSEPEMALLLANDQSTASINLRRIVCTHLVQFDPCSKEYHFVNTDNFDYHSLLERAEFNDEANLRRMRSNDIDLLLLEGYEYEEYLDFRSKFGESGYRNPLFGLILILLNRMGNVGVSHHNKVDEPVPYLKNDGSPYYDYCQLLYDRANQVLNSNIQNSDDYNLLRHLRDCLKFYFIDVHYHTEGYYRLFYTVFDQLVVRCRFYSQGLTHADLMHNDVLQRVYGKSCPNTQVQIFLNAWILVFSITRGYDLRPVIQYCEKFYYPKYVPPRPFYMNLYRPGRYVGTRIFNAIMDSILDAYKVAQQPE